MEKRTQEEEEVEEKSESDSDTTAAPTHTTQVTQLFLSSFPGTMSRISPVSLLVLLVSVSIAFALSPMQMQRRGHDSKQERRARALYPQQLIQPLPHSYLSVLRPKNITI